MRQLAVFTLIFVILCLVATGRVQGHHTGVPCGPDSNPGRAVCLPYADSSPAVQELQNTKSLSYCFNARAANYPNFISQVRDVNSDIESKFGMDWVEIGGTYSTSAQAKAAGCEVWHSMPETHGCSGCGAWVHYLNWPVIIEYRFQAGYFDWRTTIAHEVTHVLGLHEHYDDANFRSHRNTYGYWAHGMVRTPGSATDSPTVMDFGTGVYRLTGYDVAHVCQNIDPRGEIFAGCGYEEPCLGEPNGFGHRWDSCFGVWRADNGNYFIPERGWAFAECNPDNLRWFWRGSVYLIPGTAYFDPQYNGQWVEVPSC